MKFSNMKLLEETLIRVEVLQLHQKNITAAVRFVDDRRGQYRNVDTGNILQALYEEELDAWRNVFMWGLTVGEKERDRIKAAAFDRFLSDSNHVAHYMNNGVSPSSWITKDEDDFREMVKHLFLVEEGSSVD